MYVCMGGWMDEWMDGCMDVWMYGCMYVYVYLSLFIRIYRYIHIQAYIYTFLNYHETACDCVGWSIICNPYYLTGGKTHPV